MAMGQWYVSLKSACGYMNKLLTHLCDNTI